MKCGYRCQVAANLLSIDCPRLFVIYWGPQQIGNRIVLITHILLMASLAVLPLPKKLASNAVSVGMSDCTFQYSMIKRTADVLAIEGLMGF